MSSLVSGAVIVVTPERWTADDAARNHVRVAERTGRSIDGLLAEARARIVRFAPEAAWALSLAGEALIVDLRSSDERRRDGIVPGSLHVPRTVLEWRVDQGSGWSNPELDGRERRLILLCAHGYSSSLAAAVLVDLGHREAGDIEGGVVGWRDAGLPLSPAPEPLLGVLPGMAPPHGS